ncbi:DUF397 domain-containing protein [Streptomyces sp. H27-C3]|uniref:DUF397 domain-containing protein n=1 Tax=Streptomyces sp. H27-C3 TaxID=3046305 RepID=UPI0024B951AA|nr:DUF397 domain-containing protein [Streptomyces sp. H27-C3]MDJ0464048.1 DUF397 domain-containing protein [Streptomyces sp. H27-C3]
MSNLTWFKSTYSGDGGQDCIEVAYNWRKSSYSDGGGGECIEVSAHPTTIHIRDSKNTPATGPILDVAPAPWAAFVAYASSQVSGA